MYKVEFNEKTLTKSKFLKKTPSTALYYESISWLDSNCKEHYSLEYDSGVLFGIYFKSMYDLMLFRIMW